MNRNWKRWVEMEHMGNNAKRCWQWKEMSCNGKRWLTMKRDELQWKEVSRNEKRWVSMKAGEQQWKEMAQNEIRWLSIEREMTCNEGK